MDNNQINAFMGANASKFPPEAQGEIRHILAEADEYRSDIIMSTSFKSPNTMFIISFFLGGFGVDRFMLDETGLGVAKLLTGGGCGLWAFIDWITSQKRTRQYNLNKLRNI